MAQTSLNSTGVASTGALSLQSNGTTEAIGISTGQVATLAQNPILTSGTANGLVFLNASKVLTTGTELTFNGTNLSLLSSGYSVFGASSSEQMRLTSTGLGIGTSSPWSQMCIGTPNGGSLGYFGVKDTVQGGDIRFGKKAGVANNAIAGTWSNNDFEFYTNSTLRATLDTVGNLGLGVTPNANTKFDTNGPIRAGGYTVATLPTGVVGARAYVTDAMTAVFMAAPTGGGSVKTPVFYNGTAWVCG
jgi:hypothetical protein